MTKAIAFAALLILAPPALADGGTVRPTGHMQKAKAQHRYPTPTAAKGKKNRATQDKEAARGLAAHTAGH